MRENAEIAGQILYGNMDEVIIRKKNDVKVEIGEIVYSSTNDSKYFFQVFDILYGSQIAKDMLEQISGRLMEQGIGEIKEKDLRNYMLLRAKPILFLDNEGVRAPKSLPPYFSYVYFIKEENLSFLNTSSFAIGNLRSGNRILNISIGLDMEKWITHHIFIGATTGRGKSNLVKVMLWNEMFSNNVGFFILDPHDEYFGRKDYGLNSHPVSENLVYFSPNSIDTSFPNFSNLVINIKDIRPVDVSNTLDLTEAQENMMDLVYAYANNAHTLWIDLILNKDEGLLRFLSKEGVQDITFEVLRRKLINLLGVELFVEQDMVRIKYSSIFNSQTELNTISKILNALEQGKKVIVDTSSLPTKAEILITSIVVNRLFDRYKRYKREGKLNEKAKVGILLEEAPRVLSSSHNIFETISREGRKFNLGIIAITQLPSLIPPEILANMNTKIILGMEMNKERDIIISSSPQDLSKDSKIIASLDKGEGIITSIFTRFAIPFKAYLFKDVVKSKDNEEKEKIISIRGFANYEGELY